MKEDSHCQFCRHEELNQLMPLPMIKKHGDTDIHQNARKSWAEVIINNRHTSLEKPPLGSIWKQPQDWIKSPRQGADAMTVAFSSLANTVRVALKSTHGKDDTSYNGWLNVLAPASYFIQEGAFP